MNITKLTLVIVPLAFTACTRALEIGEPGVPTRNGAELHPGGAAEQPVSPIALDVPIAATTARSLFGMTFASGAPISDIVASDAANRADVLEQRITTKTDDEVTVVIELVQPTGRFSRTLVSDVSGIATRTDLVLCEQNHVATFDPRCETAAPATSEEPLDGAIEHAQWTVALLDDTTGQPVTSCLSIGDARIQCALPAEQAASYRIVTSAYGFADLWDATPGLGEQTINGTRFTGAIAPQSEWTCTAWTTTTNAVYCASRIELARFKAVDRARLDLDPITVQVTANGVATAMSSVALTWDAGDADLPGPH